MNRERPSLAELERREEFSDRHLGPSLDEQVKMLAELGLASLDQLLDQTVPAAIRLDPDRPLGLPASMTEPAASARLRELATRNQVFTSLIGLGYHGTITPPVIQRNVLEDPAWYTAYTPYQPEIAQGRLEALLNFQTMVADLTGMELANASLLDEGSAAAEAMAMSRRLAGRERDGQREGGAFFVDADCHPQTIAVLLARAEPLGVPVVVGDPQADLDPDDRPVFGVLLQYPGSGGAVRDLRPVIERAHAAGALATVAADLLALVLLAPPGKLGADVVVGSSQRFGVPMWFGGPHAAYMATREAYARSLPGRLVGVSSDPAGRPALRLALQTREQHIRRERATSNICTAQVLLAVVAGMYAVWHGPDGLRTIAERVHRLTSILAAGLRQGVGNKVEVANGTWFDTLTVRVPGRAAAVAAAARERRINLREVDADTFGVSLDETTTTATVEAVWAAFGVTAGGQGDSGDGGASVAALDADPALPEGIPAALRRAGEILAHPVFHSYHSETELLRYLRRLADKDVALDRSMIPLGSCTMKLNATSEMAPISWPEVANMHPFAPLEQARGYLNLIRELEAMLVEITGYDAVSLQPNAGSQGELAGLLAIRAWHRSRGDERRDVCLIPSSAHGTNAASAAMAGMRVVVVACDQHGNVDLGDLRAKAEQHADRLAAAMVTYPSTHGVFEAGIRDLCDLVHAAGGQVYVDGANLNAIVGVAKPGWFGADVSHLNLHKTFCIPHGGGGPGVGPVAVRAHLAPFLPNHPLRAEAGPASGIGAVAAAPWGSAGILPISWMYIAMMGADGLRRATEVAILNANYVAHRLAPHYPILYAGQAGRVAHECIIDLRPLKAAAGVSAEDVAKRLSDYGFHAPTMSFPVAGTLMIEPTESESLRELDRFCDAMIAIRREVDRITAGEWDRDDNPLHNAPHTAQDVCADDWPHPYGREQAAYPVPGLRATKWWPPVGRVDAAAGDRNLVCSCPPVTEDTEQAGT